MTNNTNNFRAKLEAEKTRLEEELSTIAKKDPQTGEWNTVPGDTEEITMREEVADRLEDNEEREATEKTLEISLKETTAALEKIDAGTYGKCEVCQADIEDDRLEANPAAPTCKAHLNG